MFKNWYVLYVKPKNEKKVAETLLKANVEVYCPMVKETKTWSDRKKTVEVPLFKSYVFVRLLEKERQLVFDFPGVVKYLFWLGKPAIVKDDEIEIIRKWLLNGDVEEYSVCALEPGDRVSLKNNMLGSKQAVVTEVGKTRVKLILEDFGVVLNMRISQII